MRVEVKKEVKTDDPTVTNEWELCLQWCRYIYDDGNSQNEYRFIWRYPPNGNLQPARGQARIPSLKIAMNLINIAKYEGWGEYDADENE